MPRFWTTSGSSWSHLKKHFTESLKSVQEKTEPLLVASNRSDQNPIDPVDPAVSCMGQRWPAVVAAWGGPLSAGQLYLMLTAAAILLLFTQCGLKFPLSAHCVSSLPEGRFAFIFLYSMLTKAAWNCIHSWRWYLWEADNIKLYQGMFPADLLFQT